MIFSPNTYSKYISKTNSGVWRRLPAPAWSRALLTSVMCSELANIYICASYICAHETHVCLSISCAQWRISAMLKHAPVRLS